MAEIVAEFHVGKAVGGFGGGGRAHQRWINPVGEPPLGIGAPTQPIDVPNSVAAVARFGVLERR